MAGASFQALFDGVGLQTPVSIGSSAISAGAVGSFTVTTTADIKAGDLVVVAVGCASGTSSFPASISDGTNTYIQVGIQTSGARNGSLWYKENAAAVPSGATITITLNTPTTGTGNPLNAIAARAATVATASSLDKNAGNVATATTTTTATTAALSQLNEVAFGASYSGSGTSYSGASGLTNLVNVTNPAGSMLALDYSIPNSASAISYSPVWVTAGVVTAVIGTFKGR